MPSIELDIRGNQTRLILLAEKHIELWKGGKPSVTGARAMAEPPRHGPEDRDTWRDALDAVQAATR